jgi:hypothetical protein
MELSCTHVFQSVGGHLAPDYPQAVLAKFVHIESIPADYRGWHVNAASASALASILSRERDRALLFRTLATLRTDIPLFDDVDQLRWKGQ